MSVYTYPFFRWIKLDQDTRCDHLPGLLKKVRLPLLTPQFLADNVASEELIRLVSRHNHHHVIIKYS